MRTHSHGHVTRCLPDVDQRLAAFAYRLDKLVHQIGIRTSVPAGGEVHVLQVFLLYLLVHGALKGVGHIRWERVSHLCGGEVLPARLDEVAQIDVGQVRPLDLKKRFPRTSS